MGMSDFQINQVVKELALLCPCQLDNVYQPHPRRLYLRLKSGRKKRLLLMVVREKMSRLHLTAIRPANPASPLAFQMFLRKHLSGVSLQAVEKYSHDRLVSLQFKNQKNSRDFNAGLTKKSPDMEAHILQVELIPRGNIFVLDSNRNIVNSMLPTDQEDRDLAPGQRYHEPAVPLAGGPGQERGKNQISPDATNRDLAPVDMECEPYPYNRAMELYFQRQEEVEIFTSRRSKLLKVLKQRIKKIGRKITRLEAERKKTANADTYQQYGELLKPLLGRIKRGQRSVRAFNYFQPQEGEIEIPLQLELDSRENLNRFFKLAKKYKRGREMVEKNLESTKEELRKLTMIRDEITEIANREKLSEIETKYAILLNGLGLAQTDLGKARGKATSGRRGEAGGQKGKRECFHLFENNCQQRIMVGKGGADNDKLTFSKARGNDLWLHVRGFAGAHVVIPQDKEREISSEILLDAAYLALNYSKVKEGEKAEVLYTRCKYVKRAKSVGRKTTAPGRVLISQEKVIFLTKAKKRLERLKRIG